MRVVFSPWRTTTTSAAASSKGGGGGGSRRTKRSTKGGSSMVQSQQQIQACFVSGRTSKRILGGGGGGGSGGNSSSSKRQRKLSKNMNSSITNSANSAVPLLALTSDHKISVVSESLAASASAGAASSSNSNASSSSSSSSLVEDSRWTYESRPGPTTAFLPPRTKSGDAKANGNIIGKNASSSSASSSSSAIPSLAAVFDASSSRIFALQNGNTTISCWDTSNDNIDGGVDDADLSSSCRANFPSGRYAVSMHRLPTAAIKSSSSSSDVSGGCCCGVAGVLDDGSLYAAMFVPSSLSSGSAALKIGCFESNNTGGTTTNGKCRSTGRDSRKRGVTDSSLGDTSNLRHLITIVSPGGGDAPSSSSAGTKRKGSMSSMADAVGVGVGVSAATASFTARVVFHDEDTGALRLVRHIVSVTASGSADEEEAILLGGDVESHSYPPIYLALPQGEENDDGKSGDGDEDGEGEESMLIDPSSIQCARLDSTAMAVVFRVPSYSPNNDGEASSEDAENIIEDETWYCIHLEGRNGEVTSAPFPLEILPGCTVVNIAGLAPNLVGVLSAPMGKNEDGDGSDEVSLLPAASLVVYDIRRSVAVQALDLPLKGDAAAKSRKFSSWDILSDYRDGTIAILAKTADQSTYISASKLMVESADSDTPIHRGLHHSTGLKRKYNLAAAIASAVSVSDDSGSSMSDALAASGLGRDIRFILPPRAEENENESANGNGNGNGVEAIVGETMQAIDDVQAAFELDSLRTFLTDADILEGEDEMATSFETAYDLAVSTLLESSLSKGVAPPASPRSIANGSSHRLHSPKKAPEPLAGSNAHHLPQSFIDGAFDIALGISLQVHENQGDGEEEAPTSDALRKVDSALRVLIKLIRSGKISARDHLAGGVMRSILLACHQIVGESRPASSDNDESPSALSLIDSILSNSSDAVPETILVTMLHHVLCYATVNDVVAFFSSPRQQRRQYLAPEKVQVLIDQMNETSAEILLLEKEKSTKKKEKTPAKKRKGEIDARLDELTALSSDLEASVLSTGVHSFADRIVSYSTVNGSLLRSAMVDTLVHAKRGEATAILSVMTNLLAMPPASKLSPGNQSSGARRTTSIAQWICALADAHLPALLDAKGTKQIAAARRAVTRAIGQGEAIASMKDLIDNAIRMASSSAGTSAAHSKRKATGKMVTYDSTGRKRLTIVQKDPERPMLSRRPASAYSIERLVI